MKKLLLLLLFPLSLFAQTTPVIKINAGGPAQAGWTADQYFSSGGNLYSTTNPIANTTEDAIYQTERWGNVTYRIPVTAGKYRVNLHFAEIWWTAANLRLFNVSVESQFTKTNIDLFKDYGQFNAGVIVADNIQVNDGFIDVVLTGVKDNAKISGISVDKYDVVLPPDPPTDTTDCVICQTQKGEKGDPGPAGSSATISVGTTTTLPAGSQATVTGSISGNNTILSFGIPGSYPPQSGGTTARAQFDVYSYGARGDGVSDDSQAFNDAFIAARNAKGTMVIPPASNFYRLNSTINIVPDASNQVWVDIKAKGKAGEIRYFGPSNTPVFKIIGLKGSLWEGLNVAISAGQSGVQIFDIQTTVEANSSSFNTFKTFYLNLGSGVNNIGIRTGAVDGGANDGKDISNYNFENLTVFGSRIAGQYAFQNLGMNTLSMAWYGGFVAFCDKVYSNISADGTKRGNGAVAFYGLGGSHNNLDFHFAFEQSYIISGGRWEVGSKFLKVSDGAYASVVVEGLVIHDYSSENVIEAANATSLTLKGVQISKTFGGTYNSCILLSANGRNGVLNMQNCALSSNVLYTKTGNTLWDITALGISKLDGVWSSGFFNNEIGIRK